MRNSIFNVFKKKPGKRICVTTYYDDAFSSIGTICRQSIHAYAQMHRLDARMLNTITSDRPAPWHKILVIKQLFAEKYDYVVWVDSDALFVDYRKNIADELEEGKELYLVKHLIESREVPNTGVLVMRNSEWSNTFLDMVWAKEEYVHHQWWENAAVIDILGYHSLLNKDRPNTLNHDAIKRIKWLDLDWNSLPGICESDRAVIKHYASRSLEYRLAGMSNDFIMYKPRKVQFSLWRTPSRNSR